MPGLFGIINYDKSRKNGMLSDPDIKASNLPIIEFSSGRYIIQATKNSRNSASYEESKVLVIFEGILLNKQNQNIETAEYLHKKYIRNGEKFAKDLRGSFQIVIIDNRKLENKIIIYSDPIASRQLFYAIRKKHIIFSPDIQPMLSKIERKTSNEIAMVNFLVSGHFPSGNTAINEIKIIGPGEYLYIKNKNIQIRKYSQFKIEPDEKIEMAAAGRELDAVLTDRIIEYWKSAEEPAILLSGGYDSQYILYKIAESVEDTSKLITVTWGQNPEKRFADMAIARRTAKRFGTHHIEIVKRLNKWRSEYDEMFIAQNGMTDSSFYHANELTVCKKLNQKWGIRSLIRGDECMGYGPEVNSAQSALKTNRMSFPEYIHSIGDWFNDENKNIVAYRGFIEGLLEKYNCLSYNCLKDTLDFYERQHMGRNPLNYYKLHYLDVFCPLIDPEVLEIVCRFPGRFKHHKNLFKQILEDKMNDELQIAQYTNLTHWEKVIGSSNEIKQFFLDEYKYLPDFLNRDFFADKVISIESSKRKNIIPKIRELLRPLKKIKAANSLAKNIGNICSNKDQIMHIPVHFLVIRAAVLSRWNRLWIKQHKNQQAN
jgi:asparagine synthetase B (glutamine-hydrolysing)